MSFYLAINHPSKIRSFSILTVCFVLIHLFGCASYNSKEKYLADFQKFIEKVSTDHITYTEDDWNNAEAEYQKYAVVYYEKYKESLTTDEKYNIIELITTFKALKVKKEILEKADGIIDDIIETINK